MGLTPPYSHADGSPPTSPLSGIIPGLSIYQSPSPSRLTPPRQVVSRGPSSPLAAWSKAKALQPSSSKAAVSTGDENFTFRVAALHFDSLQPEPSLSSTPMTANSPQLPQGSSGLDEDVLSRTLRQAAAADELLDLADATPKSAGRVHRLPAAGSAANPGLIRHAESSEQRTPAAVSTKTSIGKTFAASESVTRQTAQAAMNELATVAPAAQKQLSAGTALPSTVRQPKAHPTSDMLTPAALPKQHQTTAATPVRASVRLLNRKLANEVALAAVPPPSPAGSKAAASTEAARTPPAVSKPEDHSNKPNTRAAAKARAADKPKVLFASTAARDKKSSILSAAAVTTRQGVRHAVARSAPQVPVILPPSSKVRAARITSGSAAAAKLQRSTQKCVQGEAKAGNAKQVRSQAVASRQSARLAAKSVTTIDQPANAARWR